MKRTGLICLAIFILNFILKFWFISYTEIGLDEPFSIFHSQKSIPEIFSFLKDENNPPLHFIILHFWIKLFGVEATSVRFISVLFSSLSAPIFFLIGKRFWNFRTGLIATLIFSFANIHYYFSHDARAYSMFYFLCCLNLYFYLYIFKQTKSRFHHIAYCLVNILLCLTHFFGFVLVIAELFSFIFITKSFAKAKSLIISFFILLLSFSWYAPVIYNRFIHNSKGTWVEKPILSDLYTMLWRFSNAPLITVLFLIIIFGGFIYQLKNKSTKSDTYFLLLINFLICFVGLFIISFLIPVFVDRYLLFVSLFYFILIAISISSLPYSKTISAIVGLIAVAAMIVTVNLKTGKKSDLKGLADYISKNIHSNTSIVIIPKWDELNFTYHYNINWFKGPHEFGENLKLHSIIPIYTFDELGSKPLNSEVIVVDGRGESKSVTEYQFSNYSEIERKEFKGGYSLTVFKAK